MRTSVMESPSSEKLFLLSGMTVDYWYFLVGGGWWCRFVAGGAGWWLVVLVGALPPSSPVLCTSVFWIRCTTLLCTAQHLVQCSMRGAGHNTF